MVGAQEQDEGRFGDGLVAAALAIIGDARHSITDTKLSGAEAVHDVRKALKRWRALMRFLAGPIGDDAERMRREARELMRALTGARDAQSTIEALDDLRKADGTLSEKSMATIRGRIDSVRNTAEQSGFSTEMRERISAYLDAATQEIERWPLRDIGFDAAAEALTTTYRRARQLVPDHWEEADAEHLHDLRWRVVEHRHQMDLVEDLWPRLNTVWAEEAQRLRNRLGACQDLAVLTGFTAPHQPLAPWRSRLTPAIAARRSEHLKTAARIASRLFAEKPKAFRRRIAALDRARQPKKHKQEKE